MEDLWSWIVAILQDSIPSIITHLLHDFLFLRPMSLGLPPCFFHTMEDLWSWIVAILQDSIPSVITHLLRNFNFYCSFSWCSWRLAPCFPYMQDSHCCSAALLLKTGGSTGFISICCRPYHVECTGSLLTSEVKRHRARLVLGWGTAWEDLRALPSFPSHIGHPMRES